MPWDVVAVHLPVRDPRRGGRLLMYGHRLIIDTILYVLVSGCAWRLAPHDLAPWDAAYRWFGGGSRSGCGTTSTPRCVMRCARPRAATPRRARRCWTPSRPNRSAAASGSDTTLANEYEARKRARW